MTPLSPAESWAILLIVFVLMWGTFMVAGRVIDRIVRWAKGHDGLEDVRRRERALDRMKTWTEDQT